MTFYEPGQDDFTKRGRARTDVGAVSRAGELPEQIRVTQSFFWPERTDRLVIRGDVITLARRTDRSVHEDGTVYEDTCDFEPDLPEARIPLRLGSTWRGQGSCEQRVFEEEGSVTDSKWFRFADGKRVRAFEITGKLVLDYQGSLGVAHQDITFTRLFASSGVLLQETEVRHRQASTATITTVTALRSFPQGAIRTTTPTDG